MINVFAMTVVKTGGTASTLWQGRRLKREFEVRQVLVCRKKKQCDVAGQE